jgi:hypothetical protein
MSDSQTQPGTRTFATFKAFYPFYLGEHRNAICRRLHVIGTLLSFAILIVALATRTWWILWVLPFSAYGFAWAGHFFFEHNRPATFTHPFYSFVGDLVMAKDVLIGRVRW